jgi:hypothetical protein
VGRRQDILGVLVSRLLDFWFPVVASVVGGAALTLAVLSWLAPSSCESLWDGIVQPSVCP